MSTEETPQPRWGWIVVLLLLLGLLLVVFAQTGMQTTTQSEPNYCLNGGNNFNYGATVQGLAQDAQTYRAAHPIRANYGNASITICYNDGSSTTLPSGDPPFVGYNSQTPPENATHCEWQAFRWAEEQLKPANLNAQVESGKTVVKIFVTIFSQVVVCGPCRYQDMPTWMRDLRTAAGSQNVYLTIWQIRPGSPSSFDPGKKPEGVPLSPTDLQIVPVNFILK